jgi:exopolysaccharide production protein ExoQ
MSSSLALFAFIIGIAGLFWLDRDDSVRPSKALWLPIIWLSINGSRSVSAWLGMGVAKEIPGQLPESSSLDQLIAATLMLLGAIVLLRRGGDVTRLLKANWTIVLYFSLCLFSLLWSDFPEWGFKRWVRALGDLIMVLIVVSDAQPTAALRRLFSRTGFVLLPASVLLIKYYPQLGTDYDLYGLKAYTGVTTNKNILGHLVFVLALGALWRAFSLVRDKQQPDRTRHLLAQCVVLAFAIDLLFTAHCATATASFIFGVGLMIATSRPLFRQSPAAVHALVLAIVLAGGLTELLGGRAAVTAALGRKPDLTGRTEIWKIVIPMAPNPIGGAGFETFWMGPRVARVYEQVGGVQMTNESHNGYVEVYLNLGWLGLCLIALILLQGYRKAVSAFRRDSALGALLLVYVVTAVAFNISEAGFRMLSVAWFFLLLSVVAANRIAGLPETTSESGRELVPAAAPLGPFKYRRTHPYSDAVARRFDSTERRTKAITVESRKVDG